jgi:hypothetical protein
MPKDELKKITEDEFLSEIKKYNAEMLYNAQRLKRLSFFKQFLIINSPFVFVWAFLIYWMVKDIMPRVETVLGIALIGFLVSLVFNLLMLSWKRGRILDIALGLLKMIRYCEESEGNIEWTESGREKFHKIMNDGEMKVEREICGEKAKEAGEVR